MVITLWLMACPDKRETNFEPELNVLSVSNPLGGLLVKDFIIDRTYAIDEEVTYDLEDALVVISDSVRSETLSYISENRFHSPRNIGYDTLQVLRLMVAAEGLDTLWGETTVPGGFQILRPQWGDTLDLGDTIRFTKSRGAFLYGGVWDADMTLYDFYFPDYLPDSLVEIPVEWLVRGPDPLPEGWCCLEIAAYDSNYAEYKMHWETNTYPRYGVNGGLGVFGSAYTRSVNFYYRP